LKVNDFRESAGKVQETQAASTKFSGRQQEGNPHWGQNESAG
jgi:hypothetical protein